MPLTKLFKEFLKSEKSGGIILVFCTVFSLIVANVYPAYASVWTFSVGGHSLVHWINDGVMTLFFLLIGLELEREIYEGELSNFRNALLPAFAALGGMVFPAAIYLLFNGSGEERAGAGIPVATDIAFALTVLSMLGKRVPSSLKVFLTALAVIDDLGAILVIAVFYTRTVDLISLALSSGIFVVLIVLNRLRIHSLLPYLIGGIAMWYFMLSSGIHATLTGVLLAFAIPFGKGDDASPSYKLQEALHVPVAYVVLPLFALANTCILMRQEAVSGLGGMVSLGIIAGLFIGKPLGIFLFSYLSTKCKICSLPADMKWSHLLGAGMLAGIGFTMSIFITLMAFEDSLLVDISRLSVMLASLVAGTAGLFWLKRALPEAVPDQD